MDNEKILVLNCRRSFQLKLAERSTTFMNNPQ